MIRSFSISRSRACSNRYLLIIEYYNPTPTEVSYRGNTERLYKRDFAGEILDRYPNLALTSYGFQYHRDTNFPADDSTWFLMEKASNV
ncbi:MAG: pseudaminic acid biosynthesis-associated methylase [Hyphomicrobiales bacterium]